MFCILIIHLRHNSDSPSQCALGLRAPCWEHLKPFPKLEPAKELVQPNSNWFVGPIQPDSNRSEDTTWPNFLIGSICLIKLRLELIHRLTQPNDHMTHYQISAILPWCIPWRESPFFTLVWHCGLCKPHRPIFVWSKYARISNSECGSKADHPPWLSTFELTHLQCDLKVGRSP